MGKSNHHHPIDLVCSQVPELVYRFSSPLVASIDCTDDSQCPRADGSLGKCACKSWWQGKGSMAGYCELWVQDSSRPAYKQLWEANVRFCHQSWSPERCAIETDLVDVLFSVQQEAEEQSMDPT